jgi:hypothetical protein
VCAATSCEHVLLLQDNAEYGFLFDGEGSAFYRHALYSGLSAGAAPQPAASQMQAPPPVSQQQQQPDSMAQQQQNNQQQYAGYDSAHQQVGYSLRHAWLRLQLHQLPPANAASGVLVAGLWRRLN